MQRGAPVVAVTQKKLVAHGLALGWVFALAGLAAAVSRNWCLNQCLNFAEQAEINFQDCMEACEDKEERLAGRHGADQEEVEIPMTKEFRMCEKQCMTQFPEAESSSADQAANQNREFEDIYSSEMACNARCWPPGFMAYGMFHLGTFALLTFLALLLSGHINMGCLEAYAPDDRISTGLDGHRAEGGPLGTYAICFLGLAVILFGVGLSEEPHETGLKMTCLLSAMLSTACLTIAELTAALAKQGSSYNGVGAYRAQDIPIGRCDQGPMDV